jgi:hypothetical protein
MEKFNLEKHWEDFTHDKLAVNCPTNELAIEFLKHLKDTGYGWNSNNTYYETYRDQTCYNYSSSDKYLYFGNTSYFTSEHYSIVEFTGFTKASPKQNPVNTYNKCLTCIAHPYTTTWTLKENDEIIDIQTIESERETYKIFVYGKKVKVILPDGTRGVAKCDDNDEFDINKGKDIAYNRARIKSLSKELKKLIK